MQLTNSSVNFSAWEEKENNVLLANGLIRQSENDEFGSMMLKSSVLERNDRGFMRDAIRVAFIQGEITFLEELIEKYKIVDGTDHNKLWGDHKIVVLEKLESDFTEAEIEASEDYESIDGYSVKMTSGEDDGEELSKDGVRIFRKTVLSHVSEEMNDVLVKHDAIDGSGARADSTLVDEAKKDFTPEKK